MKSNPHATERSRRKNTRKNYNVIEPAIPDCAKKSVKDSRPEWEESGEGKKKRESEYPEEERNLYTADGERIITLHSEQVIDNSDYNNGLTETITFDLYDGLEHLSGVGRGSLEEALLRLKKEYPKIAVILHDAYHQVEYIGLYSILKAFLVLDKSKQVRTQKVYIIQGKARDKRHSIRVLGFGNFFPGIDMDEVLQESNRILPEDTIGKCKVKSSALYHAMRLIPFPIYSTASSTSFEEWRKYLPNRIQMNRWVNNRAEASYRGGRIQAFFIPKKQVFLYYYDANSLHGAAMIRHRYSVAPVYESMFDDEGNPLFFLPKDNETLYWDILRGQKPRDQFSKKQKQKNYLIFLTYSLPDGTKRVSVPQTDINGKSTEYLTGQGMFTGIDFASLYRQNAIIEVHSVVEFWNEDLFSTYVKKLYQGKESSGGLLRIFFKLAMVGLYGKFGQKDNDRSTVGDNELIKVENGFATARELMENARILRENIRIVTGNDTYNIYADSAEKSHNNVKQKRNKPVLISSEISANARYIMWEYLAKVAEKIGWEHIYYTNTDSIIADQPLDGIIPISRKIGDFKRVEEGYSKIYGINDFNVGKERKLGGIPKGSVELGERLFLVHTKKTYKADEAIFMRDLNKKELPRNLNYVELEHGYFGLPKPAMRFPKTIPDYRVKKATVFSTSLADSEAILTKVRRR